MIYSPATIRNDWGNTTPIKTAATHQDEAKLACILNEQLKTRGMVARRVNDDPYSPYDLSVCLYDWETLTRGPELCRIDAERKVAAFPKGGVPANWYRGVSFLDRKVSKCVNTDRDVYLLYDTHQRPRIIWANYETIMTYGGPAVCRGREKDIFWEVKQPDYDRLHYTFHSLVKWCELLQNREVKC